jgi:hypothetical protein
LSSGVLRLAWASEFPLLSIFQDQSEALLGKWLGGAKLSGEEWQRIASALAFSRQASTGNLGRALQLGEFLGGAGLAGPLPRINRW